MRYSAEHKQQTRDAILDAAGRIFRAGGYGGAGIDALTKAAGVTNGAFYGHFKTKSEAFRTVVAQGIGGLTAKVDHLQSKHGAAWLPVFVDLYLGEYVICHLGEACALPLLSTEVARADDEIRDVFEGEFRKLVGVMAAGLDGRTETAIAILTMLSGAATVARAILDPTLRRQVTQTVRAAVLSLAA